MIRRRFLALAAAMAATPAAAADFDLFLAGLRRDALAAGLRPEVVRAAFAGRTLNARVLELSRNQPEFTLTWTQYKARVLPAARLARARDVAAANRALLDAVQRRYPSDPRAVIGIWGLESDFGAKTGNYSVIDALTTLAYASHRRDYFRAELFASLRILDAGDTGVAGMSGSWAGAMGQPQFMPSSYLRYAVDFDGNGRRDIWTSRGDVLASISNYLAKSGWRPGEPWGQPVLVPPTLTEANTGRDRVLPLAEWQRAGVRRADGQPFSRGDVRGAVLLPDGTGGEAYMIYANFHAIRRYNPSDFYALAVGLLGNASV